MSWELPWWLSGKEFACQCRGWKFDPWVGKIPWRREWQPTPVLLPGEFHGQRSLGGSSLWGHKGSDTSEWLALSLLLISVRNHQHLIYTLGYNPILVYFVTQIIPALDMRTLSLDSCALFSSITVDFFLLLFCFLSFSYFLALPDAPASPCMFPIPA